MPSHCLSAVPIWLCALRPTKHGSYSRTLWRKRIAPSQRANDSRWRNYRNIVGCNKQLHRQIEAVAGEFLILHEKTSRKTDKILKFELELLDSE
jgi:hypothetical protein